MKNLRYLSAIFQFFTIVKIPLAWNRGWLGCHGFATHLSEQGVSLRPIQILLGHHSSKTTERYTRVSVQEIGKIKNPLDDYFN